jgi:hypothetical protein
MRIGFNFMGEDFIADIEYYVNHGPIRGRYYGPPEDCYPSEPAEWDIESICLYPYDHPTHPGFEATGELLRYLANHFSDAIEEHIWETMNDFY